MAIGDAPHDIVFVDWDDLYGRIDADDSVIANLALRGRWTAIVAAAKEGKSTVLLGLAVAVARSGAVVIYLDAEMGRLDVLDRLEEWMELKPDDLTNLHYSDLPPKLNTVEGAGQLGAAVGALAPDLIVIDGLNGVVAGAENDDTTWRDFYEFAVAPCKVRNIAIVSADNMGKDRTLGPRGSSVKLDKADVVMVLERTDTGVKLTATHRRTASYPTEQHYVVANASEDPPAMTVIGVAASDPVGTSDVVELLANLGAGPDIGIRAARRLVRAHGLKVRNTTIDAAVRLWKTPPVPGVPDIWGTTEGACPTFVPGLAKPLFPEGGPFLGTPPLGGTKKNGTANAVNEPSGTVVGGTDDDDCEPF